MQSSPENEAEPSQAVAEPDSDQLQAELERLDDRYKRALADLDNYRKRSLRETDARVAEGREQVIRDWLEAVDSVERALQTQEPENPIAEGLRQVLEQMEAILDRQGVVRTGSVGEQFDPELHEAISVQQTAEAPERTIVGVARSGYTMGDRVLRPAQVVVSRSPEAS